MAKKRRYTTFVIALVALALWQAVYALKLFPPLLFPSLADIARALVDGLFHRRMLEATAHTMLLIGRGLMIGAAIALVGSVLSIRFEGFGAVYQAIVALCDPLPGIALMPLAILWFGTGEAGIVFLIVHSVAWPLSRSLIEGFRATPPMYLEIGRNIGLNRFGLMRAIYLPASLSYALLGLKTGWARAWRAVISAEMLFGVAGNAVGIGWHIYTSRYQMDTAGAFAALAVIILASLAVEYGLFRTLENLTLKRWGMVK